ncbi:MAG: transcriptional repressor LexA [Pseudomonadota bacterium]
MLTAQQANILAFIEQTLLRSGKAPTLAEIGSAVGIRSRGAVHRHVQALTEKGYLERKSHGWRAMRLGEEHASRAATLPLLGRIAAGQPIEAIPDQEEINLMEFLLGPDRYALLVKGDSMIEAGILDGDTVIIRRGERARSGDIVVALIDDQEATLKRIKYRTDGYIELIPANAGMPTMIYSAERVRIQGVLVGQFRTYG